MNADKLAQLRELFETWLASRPSFRTTVEVQAAWEGWKANTAVAAMLAEHDAQPAQAAQWPDALKAVGFNDAAAVIGYLDDIDSEVARITGDEGDDSSLEVLRRMPAQAAQQDKRWPFVESPGEFTERLRKAMQDCPLIGAVRQVLIENPPKLAQAAQPVGVPDELRNRVYQRVQWLLAGQEIDVVEFARDVGELLSPQPPAQPGADAASNLQTNIETTPEAIERWADVLWNGRPESNNALIYASNLLREIASQKRSLDAALAELSRKWCGSGSFRHAEDLAQVMSAARLRRA